MLGGKSKKLSFWQATAIGLGNIVGAGIFVLAGSAMSASGPGVLLAFGITAILAMTVGLNSAELTSKFPRSEGGVYSFARATLGESVGFLVGWFRLISYAVSGGAVALGFSAYLLSLGLPASLYFPLAILLVLALSCVEIKGLRFASKTEEGLVIVNLVGLILFVLSVSLMGRYSAINFTPLFPNGGEGVLRGATIAFFAYSGFNTIATLTPDVENGETTVPRAIIFSLVTSTALYVLVAFSMLFAFNWRLYGTAPNPLMLALSAVKAPTPIVLATDFAALTATVTVTLSLIIAGSRTTKQMAKDHLLPKWFGKGSIIPTVVVAAVMLASLGLGDVESIALVASFGVIFSYMLSGIEVIVARRNRLKGKFLSPGYPYLQWMSVALSALLLITLGSKSILLGTATLVVGLIVHAGAQDLRK